MIAMNGVGVPAVRPRRHHRGSLTQQQRLLITVCSIVLGLIVAYWISGGKRSWHPGTAAGGSGGAAAGAAAKLSARGTQQQATAARTDSSAHSKGSASLHSIASKQQGEQRDKGAAATEQAEEAAGQQQAKQKQQQQGKAQQEHVVHAGMEDEREWYSKLSAEACSHVDDMRVCSHRGQLAVDGVAPGSLAAYTTLIKAGVSCFDVDVVQTADGQLLASHPEDLQAAVASSNAAAAASMADLAGRVQEFTLAQLREAGADEDRFPTADTLIKVFASALDDGGLLWRPGTGEDAPDYEQLPVLLLELKGPAFSANAINSLAAAAQTAEAAAHVAVYASDPQQLSLVQQQAAWNGPLIRAYFDRLDPNPLMSPEEVTPFTLLGPSLKMSDSFFAAAVPLGKPVLAWTADSPADLHRAAEAKLNAVISNRPLGLRAVLMDWRDRCSEQQRRQQRLQRRLG